MTLGGDWCGCDGVSALGPPRIQRRSNAIGGISLATWLTDWHGFRRHEL